MNAPPNALRTITVTLGTLASANACTSLAPWRITPSRSWRDPGMKPGVSTSTSSGSPNELHLRTNRAAFCAALASSTPPRCRGWLATIADRRGRPCGRTRVTRLRAQPGADLQQVAAVDKRAGDVGARRRPGAGRPAARGRVVRPGGSRLGTSAARQLAWLRQVAEQVARQQRARRPQSARRSEHTPLRSWTRVPPSCAAVDVLAERLAHDRRARSGTCSTPRSSRPSRSAPASRRRRRPQAAHDRDLRHAPGQLHDAGGRSRP